MSETYNITFSSRNANALIKTNLTQIPYTVNWKTFLPTKYKKFKCNFIFRSDNTQTALNLVSYVTMSFGAQMNCFDGTSQTNILGIVQPYSITNGAASSYYYIAKTTDNNSFTMSYPNDNLITLYLKNVTDNASQSNALNYVLILSMVGIPDEE